MVKKYINVPKINVPFTTIVNRAQVPDLSKDLGVRMGVERIPTQSIFRLSDEQGPNGENIYGVEGDDLGLVRFVGDWVSLNDSTGVRVKSSSAGNYVEITFKGTGLNILTVTDTTGTGLFNAFLDNVALPDISFNGSVILQNRNYAPNVNINAVSGLSDGVHTIRVVTTAVDNYFISGYEVLNESTQLTINSGEGRLNDAVITTLAQSNLAYNSGFESGTLGTRGGRVAVYQKIDGTIGHAVTPVDATQKNLALADHSNEEVSRVYNFREFGAGRADDFSTLSAAVSNRAFTLDDGSTTLIGKGVFNTPDNHININTQNTGLLSLTFIGTGLDIIWKSDVGNPPNPSANSFTVSIDGGAPFNWDTISTVNDTVKKIASGLNYGSHIVTINRNAPVSWTVTIKDFIVYQPKTPIIPVNANLLGTYNILADYVLALTPSNLDISKGVIHNSVDRESVYSGSHILSAFGAGVSNNFISGIDIRTSTIASYVEYTFFGIGVEWNTFHLIGNAINVSITIDGLALNVGTNIGSAATVLSFVSGLAIGADGNLTGTTSGVNGNTTISITNLTIGKHTIRITQNTTTNMYSDGFSRITPIYSPVQNTRNKQSTLAIGNNSIADHRKFSELENVVKKVNYSRVVGASLPGSITTTSTAPVPLPEFITQLETNGNAVEVNFNGSFYISAINIDIISELYIDGKLASRARTQPTGPDPSMHSISDVFKLDKGVHTFQMFWWVNGATTGLFWYPSESVLTVKEL